MCEVQLQGRVRLEVNIWSYQHAVVTEVLDLEKISQEKHIGSEETMDPV